VVERELLEFIQASIRSVWNVELLLRLKRSGDRAWGAEELVRELRASHSVVGEGLRILQAAGLVRLEENGRVRYAPASPHSHRMTLALEELYRTRPTTVTHAIFARSNDKLRTFAAAFRFKRD
jgi:DNA-binding transcriptional ArsR family regulator